MVGTSLFWDTILDTIINLFLGLKDYDLEGETRISAFMSFVWNKKFEKNILDLFNLGKVVIL